MSKDSLTLQNLINDIHNGDVADEEESVKLKIHNGVIIDERDLTVNARSNYGKTDK